MFISTPSLEPVNNRQGTEGSKRKLPHQNSPSATESGPPKPSSPEEQLKTSFSSFSQPSEAAEAFQLELSSENSCFAQKTQSFIVEEDSQATQIEDQGTVVAVKSNSSPKHHFQNENKNSTDSEPSKASNSQSHSNVHDSKITSAVPKKAEDLNVSQKLNNGGNRNTNAAPGTTLSQLSVSSECVSATPNLPQTSKTTDAGCPQASTSTDKPANPVPVAQHTQSQSILTASSQKNIGNKEERDGQNQRLSQPMLHSHSVTTDSVRKVFEEEERMEEGEIQSTVKGDDTGINLALSQSQALSPEPMEEEKGEASRDRSSSREESFSVMVLEESQRVSQEKVKEGKSPPFKSSSQPVSGSVQDKPETLAKISGSQPAGSTKVSPLRLEKTKSQSTQSSSSGQPKVNFDNAANKSLSDSSGGGIKMQTNGLLSVLIN